MVKGNWERRVEQAQLRREENKAKKEEKKKRKDGGGEKRVNGESVWSKLLQPQFLHLRENAIIEAWLEFEPGEPVCSTHMRTAECRARRCPFSHNCDSLSRYRNAQTIDGQETELACFSVPFKEVLPRHRLLVRFVAIDGSLVFDAMRAELWSSFLETSGQRSRLFPLSSVLEEERVGVDEQDTEVDVNGLELESLSMEGQGGHRRRGSSDIDIAEDTDFSGSRGRGDIVVEDRAGESSFLLSLLVDRVLVQRMFGFLSIQSIGTLMRTCRALKKALLKDDAIRVYRKECFALCAGDESRRKKAEKKKRIVNGNAKKSTGKKDEFARGGNTG